jgi:hypothetical protein
MTHKKNIVDETPAILKSKITMKIQGRLEFFSPLKNYLLVYIIEKPTPPVLT